MKKTLFMILVSVMLIGLLKQFTLPVSALESIAEFDLENLRFDDHVDMTGRW